MNDAQCSVGCGTGRTVRNVTCTNGRTIMPKACNAMLKPPNTKVCEALTHCRWRISKPNKVCVEYWYPPFSAITSLLSMISVPYELRFIFWVEVCFQSKVLMFSKTLEGIQKMLISSNKYLPISCNFSAGHIWLLVFCVPIQSCFNGISVHHLLKRKNTLLSCQCQASVANIHIPNNNFVHLLPLWY